MSTNSRDDDAQQVDRKSYDFYLFLFTLDGYSIANENDRYTNIVEEIQWANRRSQTRNSTFEIN